MSTRTDDDVITVALTAEETALICAMLFEEQPTTIAVGLVDKLMAVIEEQKLP